MERTYFVSVPCPLLPIATRSRRSANLSIWSQIACLTLVSSTSRYAYFTCVGCKMSALEANQSSTVTNKSLCSHVKVDSPLQLHKGLCISLLSFLLSASPQRCANGPARHEKDQRQMSLQPPSHEGHEAYHQAPSL